MDLSRLQQLAGMPVTEASKTVEKTEIHISMRPHSSGGLMGDMVNVMDPNVADALALVLGIQTGWKIVKVGTGFASYMKGHQLSFFTDKNDFDPELFN